MRDWIVAFALLFGAALIVIAAVGLLRMPDLFTRMHAATKAATIGAASLLFAFALRSGSLEIATRALLVAVFIGVTAPVAAQALARASYFAGIPLWEGTRRDELRERFDPSSRSIRGLSE